MIESSFQLARGVGARRERELWRAGVAHWDDLPPPPAVAALAPRTDRALRAAIDSARAALAARDADRVAALLPAREHWRLYAAFAADAAYLDIETSDDVIGHAGISAIGVLDAHGPRQFLAGRDLDDFPAAARAWPLLVTFNGGSFDLPILRRAFPDWEPPRAHVDLRHIMPRLGLPGGLKSLERRLPLLHLRRPPHLDGLDGWDTGSMFRRGRQGDREALRRFAEYNLYDTVNLRTLMAWAYNALVAAEAAEAPALAAVAAPVAVPERGDVLYDVSKLLLAL
jgi:uncharacterized protein YprB with RNaseH-like and TPR domain